MTDNILKHYGDGRKVPNLCGAIYEVTTVRDYPMANAVYLEASEPGNLHYHKQTTEFYFIVEGTGWIQLNDRKEAVHPGMMVLIRPATRHKIIPAEGRTLGVWVVASPAWSAEDEFEVFEAED